MRFDLSQSIISGVLEDSGEMHPIRRKGDQLKIHRRKKSAHGIGAVASAAAADIMNRMRCYRGLVRLSAAFLSGPIGWRFSSATRR